MSTNQGLLAKLNRIGLDSQAWLQDVFSNVDSSLVNLWLPGSGYNRSIVRARESSSPVEIRDYIGSRDLTVAGTPTLGATSTNAGPNAGVLDSYYYNTMQIKDVVQDSSGATIPCYSINRLSCGTNPTNFANNDTITVNGKVITLKSSGADPSLYQVNIVNAGTTLTAVAALINTNSSYFGCTAWVDPNTSNTSAAIWFQANVIGAAGNALTLAQSLSCTTKTIRGATFDGGDQPSITIMVWARSGVNGDFFGAGFTDSLHSADCLVGLFESAPGGYTQGMSAYCSQNSGNRQVARVAGEAGHEGVDWFMGAITVRSGLVWVYRARNGLAYGTQGFTEATISLPLLSGQFQIASGQGASILGAFGQKGDVAMVAVRNVFTWPSDFETYRTEANTNLLTGLGMPC